MVLGPVLIDRSRRGPPLVVRRIGGASLGEPIAGVGGDARVGCWSMSQRCGGAGTSGEKTRVGEEWIKCLRASGVDGNRGEMG